MGHETPARKGNGSVADGTGSSFQLAPSKRSAIGIGLSCPVEFPAAWHASRAGQLTPKRLFWLTPTPWGGFGVGRTEYGLYPDWIEDLRLVAGQQIVNDMANGAEAYLQMWARAEAAAG